MTNPVSHSFCAEVGEGRTSHTRAFRPKAIVTTCDLVLLLAFVLRGQGTRKLLKVLFKGSVWRMDASQFVNVAGPIERLVQKFTHRSKSGSWP